MRKWSWRKIMIHAAMNAGNPLGLFLHDDFRRALATREAK